MKYPKLGLFLLMIISSGLIGGAAIISAGNGKANATEPPTPSDRPLDSSFTSLPSQLEIDLDPSNTDDPMAQVSSVSQFSDVKPTDWAFQALRSLVERYGCIVGYSDKTYRGNRALTRWEFAAGLNACLDKIQELIATATADFVKKADLETIKRLQELFAAELAVLRGRVDALEVRTTTLEKQQFSATTKLFGEAVFVVSDAFGGETGSNTNTFLFYRASLNLQSSFTGQDLLRIGLKAGNVTQPNPVTGGVFGFALPGTVARGRFVPTAEGTLSSMVGANLTSLTVTTLEYQFPLGDRLRVYVAPGSETFNQFANTLNPYFDDVDGGKGAISTFGQRSPLYRLAGGPGAGFNFQISDQLTLSAAYLSSFVFGGADPNQGLFNSSYGALAQVTWKPSPTFGLGAIYINSYYTPGRFGFNNLGLALTGTAVARTLGGQIRTLDTVGDLTGIDNSFLNGPPVIANSYGGQFTFQPNSNLVLNGWFGFTNARLIGQGDGQILTYALNVGFPNLGQPGNLLGFVLGAEPYLTKFKGGNPQPFKVDIPWHVEGFYRWQINDRISVTPGFIWLLAPNQDNNNPQVVIGVIRTTFNF